MKRILSLAVLGLALSGGLLAGCDPNTKATVLTGLQGGATTIASALITAGFQSLLSGTTGGTTTTTTQ